MLKIFIRIDVSSMNYGCIYHYDGSCNQKVKEFIKIDVPSIKKVATIIKRHNFQHITLIYIKFMQNLRVLSKRAKEFLEKAQNR